MIPNRATLCILLLFFGLIGCTTTSPKIRTVWVQADPPSELLPPPPGFTITPAQALAAARESDALSLTRSSHIYADSRYYYVYDAFLGGNPQQAHVKSVQVDGNTGAIVPR